MKLVPVLVASMILAGCASGPQAPQEPPITVQIAGTSVEVQQFIERRLVERSGGQMAVENATDRELKLKISCAGMPNMNPLQCAGVMMAVGNSRWDGPYLFTNFRTAQIRDVVHLSGNMEWCAFNALGRKNCMPAASNAEMNSLLRNIEADLAK